MKKENGSTELEEGEIADPPKRPIPPPLPFDPPKPLDSYEYKGPLGRGQRREEMVKRGDAYILFSGNEKYQDVYRKKYAIASSNQSLIHLFNPDNDNL